MVNFRVFFFSSRRRHTRLQGDWSSDVCSSDLATKDERKGIRDERKDQDLNARDDTRNAMGRELGADFMLTGTINTIVDPNGNEQLLFYQVNMTLISLADNRKVWVGQKDI